MILDEFALTDKVAIVTGSGRGIGRCLAVGLAQAGADIVVTSRHVEQCEETAKLVRELGRRAFVVTGDLRNSEDVAKMAEKVVAEFGRIDILVNNAGGTRITTPAQDLAEKGWDSVVATNLKSVFLVSQAVGRVMLKQKKGVIVNITSVAGRDASSLLVAYGAAKAGVVNLTRSLALAWGSSGIRVNCVGPGATGTAEARTVLWNTPEKMAAAVASISLGRIAEPEEIVGPVVFLASDASSFINGQTIWVDGGKY
ncbi:MAG: glucose 1-dehydrogenase [Dehalococcoidia bacterium]|nr:glucose 1-dehydrogenase [Dehalococcoidia bacterium]